MGPGPEPAKSAEKKKKWHAGVFSSPGGWPRYILSGTLLLYSLYVVKAVYDYSSGAKVVAGYAIVAVFAVCYLLTLPRIEKAGPWEFWALFAFLVVLLIAELPFAQAEAFRTGRLHHDLRRRPPRRRSWPVVVVLTVGAILLPALYPPWHDSLSTGFRQRHRRRHPDRRPHHFRHPALAAGHSCPHRGESGAGPPGRAHPHRPRHARPARPLADDDNGQGRLGPPPRARPTRTRALQEMAEVEAIARGSLADVRAAVSNYHVTLAGELASGRELLRAAGISADLPGAVDVVDPAHQELFGWVVREGLTNIVRHAHATSCAVRLSASSVEVVDDGVGGDGRPGNGLSGLRDRVPAAGGVVDVGPREPKGWRLQVSLASRAGA